MRLNGILDKKNFVLLNQGKIHPYSMEQGSAIDKLLPSIAEKYPDSFFLHLSINGDIMQYSGNMFPSITIANLNRRSFTKGLARALSQNCKRGPPAIDHITNLFN